jgi:PAS domain S-box-containing protein
MVMAIRASRDLASTDQNWSKTSMRRPNFWQSLGADTTIGAPQPAAARVIVGVCALLVGGAGVAALVGWAFDIVALKGVVPGLSTMKANTAAAFLLCASALAFGAFSGTRGQKRAGQTLALAASLIGLLTLIEYVANVDLGIDQMLFAATDENGHTIPGRMSPPTAFGFLLFGAAFALPRHAPRAGDVAFLVLIHLAAAAPAAACLGYLFGVRELFAPTPTTSIAITTALAFMGLLVGASALRSEIGWGGLLRSPGTAGVLTRVLLPAIVVLPLVLGGLTMQAAESGIFDLRTGMAILTGASIFVLSGVVWFNVSRVDRFERQRARQEMLQRTVLDNAFDAFILMDKRGIILEWNTNAEKIFGWTRAEALGRPVADTIVPPELRQAHAAGLARFLATGESRVLRRRNEMQSCKRDGSTFPVELVITPIPLDHELVFSGFVRDMSEQKRTEEQLRQSQKMEAVGQLTGGVAHDFNNLLTVIIGSLEIAEGKVDDALRPAIQNALTASERGATLVQQLLAMSRRQTLAPSALDFNQLVAGMGDMLRRSLGEHIEIEMQYGPNLWAAEADKGQVENALLNLAINARDAMPGGGKLTIETANVTLDEDYTARSVDVRPGEYVMVALTDTGVGMTAEVVSRAFEPFFTTKGVGKGTGLGLSMVYGFAKQSRGHLKIYSEVGHGTTVRLYLPRFADEAAAATVASERIVESGGNETILVVEDDTDVRLYVVSQLRDLGYRVIHAPNGLEAERVLNGGAPIDLLLTDVVMPGGMTGRDLAERAARIRPGLKVLFTSGYTENAIVHHGRLDPDVNFLPKPYRRHELARKVREALR